MQARSLTGPPATATGRTVSGYAALFNARSQNLGTADSPVFEVIQPGAFPDLTTQDVRALLNHEASAILARSKRGKGTLKLSIDARGLRYEFQAPNTQAGNDLLESIRRGDVDQSSFSFIVAKGGDSFRRDGSATIRTITKIQTLLDVSPVAFPAYEQTTVSARCRQRPESKATRQLSEMRLSSII